MKVVSDVLKNTLKQPTTQRKGKILVNGNYYEVYNVEYYADVYNDGNVIGNAIASQLDFDLPYMAKFDSFKYFDGVWTGSDYEFVDMGTFTVVDEKDEDEFNKHITSFDNLIKFNAPFEDKNDYPKTLFQELQNICNQAGVELVNNSIVNGSFIVENNQFVAGENLKTVLKNICGVSGTYATIKNDELVLQLQNETDEIMNKGQHEPIEWKRKTYGINQVVLGLKDVGGEYVVKQDDEDITENGVHKLVINDNYFAYTQEKRQQLINGLFEQVKGFGYVPYELKGEWLNYMDVGDTITIDGIETIVLRINGKSPKGLESIMSSPAIIDSAIEYVDNTNTLANQQRRTELLVDKELGEIRGEVSNVETTVQDITTTTQTSTGGNSLYITDALESNALEYHVEGKSEQDGTPTPDAPVEIKTVKGVRNLFDKDNVTLLNGYVNTDGTLTSASNWVVTSSYIKIKPNTEYIISAKNMGTRFVYAEYNSEDVTTMVGQRKEITPKTSFTTSETTNYIRFCINNPDATDFQLEEGSTIHNYVSYGSWLITKITGKNLIKQPYFQNDKTILGITFKTNDDYTVNVNGTSTGNAIFYLTKDDWNYNSRLLPTFKAGTYTFKATGNSNVEFVLNAYKKDGTNEYVVITTKDVVKTFTEDVKLNMRLLVPNGKTANNVNVPIQVEKGTVATEYEEYKEKEVLIDLNKPNLFNKNTITPNYRLGSDGLPYANNGYFLSDFISVDSLTEYTYERLANNISEAICYYDENKNFISRTTNLRKDVYIFKTTETTKYIRIADSIDSVDISKLYEGYTDYHELSSIGDTKDELNIIDGQVVIDKKIDKVIFDGSEGFATSGAIGDGTHYRFTLPLNTKVMATETITISNYFNGTTYNNRNSDYQNTIYGNGNIGINTNVATTVTELKTWLSENNTTVYYILAEPQQITLSNTNIELFEGVNHITLVDDLETTTSIKYYRNTPIAQDYVVQQQLDKTNNELNNTTSKTNENTLNINATNTNLNNNYYTKPQIDVMNTSTTQEITTIKKEVETKVTAEDLTIAINQIKTTSASSVETSTGYKFDENGLSIKKSDSQMSSLLDNDGLVVKRDTTEVLTVRSSGVQTENLTVRTYFTIGDNTRAENYKGGTGFFYIGGDN